MKKRDTDPKSKKFFDWLSDYDIAAALSRRNNDHSEIDALLKALIDDGFLIGRIHNKSPRDLRGEFIWAAIAAIIKAKDIYQKHETRKAYAAHINGEGNKLLAALNQFLQAIPRTDPSMKDLTDAHFHSSMFPPELGDRLIKSAFEIQRGLEEYEENIGAIQIQSRPDWLANIFAQNVDHKWNEIVVSGTNGSIIRKHELALALWRLMEFPFDDARDRDANDYEWMRSKFRVAGKLPPEN